MQELYLLRMANGQYGVLERTNFQTDISMFMFITTVRLVSI